MILFQYILKDFLKYVFGIVFLTIFLFILFDFIHKTTGYFARYHPKTEDIILLYIYQIPMQLAQALPIAALLGSVICMVLLSRTNEITAMRAAGMGPFFIAAPIIFGGSVLCIASFIIGEFIVPVSSERMRFVESVKIEGRPASEVIGGARWIKQDNLLYHYEDYDPVSRTLSRVKIIEAGLNFRPKIIYDAPYAVYDDTQEKWKLQKVQVRHFTASGTIAQNNWQQDYWAALPLDPNKLKKDRRDSKEMSLWELREIIKRNESSGIDALSYLIDFHMKLAFYFASLVVSLVGLKFAYRSERTVETAKGILLAVAIGISYWFIMNIVGQALTKRGHIPPVMGAWMANIIIFLISVIDLWRVTRRA